MMRTQGIHLQATSKHLGVEEALPGLTLSVPTASLPDSSCVPNTLQVSNEDHEVSVPTAPKPASSRLCPYSGPQGRNDFPLSHWQAPWPQDRLVPGNSGPGDSTHTIELQTPPAHPGSRCCPTVICYCLHCGWKSWR